VTAVAWKVVLAIVAAAILLFVLQMYGQRRVRAGQGRFVWLRFIHFLIVPVAILWAGAQQLAHQPVAGLILLVIGGGYAAILFLFLTRLSRSVTSAGRTGDWAAATKPAEDFIVTMVGFNADQWPRCRRRVGRLGSQPSHAIMAWDLRMRMSGPHRLNVCGVEHGPHIHEARHRRATPSIASSEAPVRQEPYLRRSRPSAQMF